MSVGKKKQRTSLQQLLQAYLRSHSLRPSSIKNYRSIVHYVQQETNIVWLDEFDEEVALSWRNAVLKRASAITWNNYYTHLRALLNYALKKGWVTENILLSLPKTRVPKLRKKTIDVDSLPAVFQTIDRHEKDFHPKWFWKTVIKVLLFTGMRQNQLLNLTWKDINFDTLDIQLTYKGSKTHREWSIPLPKGCFKELCHLREQTERVMGPVDISDHLVFRLQLFNQRYSGKSLNAIQIQVFFQKLSTLSGIRITAHRLRHTFATLIAQNGRQPDLKSLQYIMGHTDIRTTMAYIEPKKKHLERVMNQLRIEF